MPETLNWRPVPDGRPLGNALRDIFKKHGVRCGTPHKLTSSDVSFLDGILAAAYESHHSELIEGADALLKAIAQHREIQLFLTDTE